MGHRQDRRQGRIGAGAGWLIVVAALAAGPLRPGTAQADTASDLEALPGLATFSEAVSFRADGDGYRLSVAGAGGVTGLAFQAGGGWHVAVRVPTAALSLAHVPDLGGVTPTMAMLVISQQATSLDRAALPTPVAAPLAPFGAAIPVAAGVNVFATGAASGTGVIGQLVEATGASTVRLAGAVGADVLVAALRSAGASTDNGATDPPEGPVSLTVGINADATPPLFKGSSAALRSLFHVVVRQASLTATKAGATVTFGGALDAAITVRGNSTNVSGALAVARSAGSTTLRIRTAAGGEQGLAVSNLLGQTDASLKVDLTSIGLDATFTRNPAGVISGGLALAVKVTRDGTSYRGTLSGRGATGAGLQELALEVDGNMRVTIPGGESITLEDPQLGLLIASRGAYAAATVRWRGSRTNAVVWGQLAPAGLTVFLDVEAGRRLADLLGVDRLPVNPIIGRAVTVLSTVEMRDVALASLPQRAGAALGALGVSALTCGVGASLMASFDFGTAVGAADRDELAKGGIAGPMLLQGSVRVDGGKPAFDLYAALPTFKIPPAWTGKLPTPTTTPRVFLSLTGGVTPTLSAGAELQLDDWKLDGVVPADLLARLYLTLGGGAPALQVTGKLTSDWVSPLRLTGITIAKDTGVSVNLAVDSARVILNGGLRFGGLSYGLGGGYALQWATGLPTPKGLALRLAADELGLIALAEVGQVAMRAGANLAGSLVGATGAPLPPAFVAKMAAVKNADLVSAVKTVVPQNGPVAEMLRWSLRDAKLFIATPGMQDPDFPDLNDVGLMVKGALYRQDSRLAAIDAYVTSVKGMQLQASSADIPLGPLLIKAPTIDLGVSLPDVNAPPPRFKISGKTAIKDVELTSLEVALSPAAARLSGSVDLCAGEDKCFGTTVALSGTITSPTEASLTGSADINPPNFGDVKVGEFEASFTLDTDDGLEFSGRGELAGAGLSISGSFTRPGSWSITGTGKVDTGTKRFKVGDIEVITLKVESGSLSLSLSPRGATVRAKGKASVNPLGIATFSWDFDQDVTSDFEIHKTVSFRIAGVGDDLVISYNVFP